MTPLDKIMNWMKTQDSFNEKITIIIDKIVDLNGGIIKVLDKYNAFHLLHFLFEAMLLILVLIALKK